MAEGSIAADELRLLVERIERLEEEKKAAADDERGAVPPQATNRWLRVLVGASLMSSFARRPASFGLRRSYAWPRRTASIPNPGAEPELSPGTPTSEAPAVPAAGVSEPAARTENDAHGTTHLAPETPDDYQRPSQ